MPIHINDLIGHSGGKVHYAIMLTCSGARGTGIGSEKFYFGAVVERDPGVFDGICASGKIGANPVIRPQVTEVSQVEAQASVDAVIKTKKAKYKEDAAFLAGYDGETAVLERKEVVVNGDALPIYWAMLLPNNEKKMLALLPEILKDTPKDSTTGWILTHKHNGRRKLTHVRPGGMRFVGRSGSTAAPDVPLEDNNGMDRFQIDAPALYGSVLDGELIAVGQLASGGHSGVATAKASNPDSLVIVLYDIVAYAGADLTSAGQSIPYYQRRRLLVDAYGTLQHYWVERGRDLANFPYVLIEEIYTNKREYHEAIKALPPGQNEGTVPYKLDGLYHQGEAGRREELASKRKIKGTLTGGKVLKYEDDVVIVGYTKGKAGNIDKIGAVRFAQYVDRDFAIDSGLIKALVTNIPSLPATLVVAEKVYVPVELGKTSGMNQELRLEFTEKGDHYLGRIMKVTGSWRLPSGAIENVQFEEIREEGDKAPTECIWNGAV